LTLKENYVDFLGKTNPRRCYFHSAIITQLHTSIRVSSVYVWSQRVVHESLFPQKSKVAGRVWIDGETSEECALQTCEDILNFLCVAGMRMCHTWRIPFYKILFASGQW
jgi:ribulose 1,5-bisphosphate synthetase/thiazole synthase